MKLRRKNDPQTAQALYDACIPPEVIWDILGKEYPSTGQVPFCVVSNAWLDKDVAWEIPPSCAALVDIDN